MKLSGQAQAEVVKMAMLGAGVLVAVWAIRNAAQGTAKAVGNAVADVVDTVLYVPINYAQQSSYDLGSLAPKAAELKPTSIPALAALPSMAGLVSVMDNTLAGMKGWVDRNVPSLF